MKIAIECILGESPIILRIFQLSNATCTFVFNVIIPYVTPIFYVFTILRHYCKKCIKCTKYQKLYNKSNCWQLQSNMNVKVSREWGSQHKILIISFIIAFRRRWSKLKCNTSVSFLKSIAFKTSWFWTASTNIQQIHHCLYNLHFTCFLHMSAFPSL